MKHFLIFFAVVALIVSISAFAQTQEVSSNSKGSTENSKQNAETPTPTPHSEVSKVPRVYPITAGVWYPGDPLPEKPFRYYRVRCWPGCHSYGKYADPPKTEKSAGTSY